MIIAIKREDGVTLGVSCKDSCCDMLDKDYTLLDNLPAWKVKGNTGCYAATGELDFSGQLIRAYARSLSKIKGPNDIINQVIPEMKSLLKDFRLSDGKKWGNELLIVKDGRLYHLTSHFVLEELQDAVVLARNSLVQMGCLEATRGQTAEKRIVETYRFLSKVRNENLFPIVLWDTKTGRKKVISK